jgi:eukaryotic-like serine/threonine-protein kinase
VVDESSAETQAALTLRNVIQGTPGFIAPEQALGGGDVDIRTDIYSTGCVAYWLLTGRLVFEADTTMKTLMAHAYSAPQPPSARTPTPIPADLDALILSCLAKEREHRPQSARELLARLDAVHLPQAWTEARAREWWDAQIPR